MRRTAIYLDHAAATPLGEQVRAAMEPFFSSQFHNPSALYLSSRATREAVERARRTIANLLGAKPGEIIFTSGATESNNLAIQGILRKHPDGKVLVSAIEHESVRTCASKMGGKEVPVLPSGLIDLTALRAMVDDQTVIISVMHANNEIGIIQPIREISKLIAEVRRVRMQKGNAKPLYLHTDAAQSANYLDLHVNRLGVDLLSLNGGKIYGPKGVGVLYLKAGTSFEPLLYGGGQESGWRSGTENVPSIVGMAAALDETVGMARSESERLKDLQKNFLDLLEKSGVRHKVNGSLKNRLPNNLNLSFPGIDNERLLMELDERGIQVATGSACSASHDEPSHVLKAIGLEDTAIFSSIRITMGRGTLPKHMVLLVRALNDIINSDPALL